MSDTSTPSGQPVELASQGRYYKSGSSRALLNTIRGEYEAMISDASAQNFPTVLDQVLRDLTSEVPAESFDKLLIGDKYHLLFHLRMISYPNGNEYGFNVTCPNCSHPSQIIVNLQEDVKIQHPPKDAEEPFEVSLPVSNRVAKMRLLRVFDEQEMIKFIRKARTERKLRGDPAYYFTIAKGLLFLDDEEMELDAAIEFVKQASGADTQAIRDALDDMDVGPQLDMDFTCESCHHFWFQRMPLDADFFRPGVAGRRRRSRPAI
jgi:hypothetical protein